MTHGIGFVVALLLLAPSLASAPGLRDVGVAMSTERLAPAPPRAGDPAGLALSTERGGARPGAPAARA